MKSPPALRPVALMFSLGQAAQFPVSKYNKGGRRFQEWRRACARRHSHMKSSSDPERRRDSRASGKIAAEQLVDAIASRYGFRSHDFSIVWDGGDFDAARTEHEMLISSKDGRQARAHIDDDALLRKDAWKYLREVDAAFASLRRRTSARGI